MIKKILSTIGIFGVIVVSVLNSHVFADNFNLNGQYIPGQKLIANDLVKVQDVLKRVGTYFNSDGKIAVDGLQPGNGVISSDGTNTVWKKLTDADVDLSTVQKRISGTCSFGIDTINSDGTVSCADDTAYAKNADVVHLTGDETISGNKTFNGTINGSVIQEGGINLADKYVDQDSLYDANGIVKAEKLPFKKAQFVGKASGARDDTLTSDDSLFYFRNEAGDKVNWQDFATFVKKGVQFGPDGLAMEGILEGDNGEFGLDTKDGEFVNVLAQGQCSSGGRCVIADINGDGNKDLIRVQGKYTVSGGFYNMSEGGQVQAYIYSPEVGALLISDVIDILKSENHPNAEITLNSKFKKHLPKVSGHDNLIIETWYDHSGDRSNFGDIHTFYEFNPSNNQFEKILEYTASTEQRYFRKIEAKTVVLQDIIGDPADGQKEIIIFERIGDDGCNGCYQSGNAEFKYTIGVKVNGSWIKHKIYTGKMISVREANVGKRLDCGGKTAYTGIFGTNQNLSPDSGVYQILGDYGAIVYMVDTFWYLGADGTKTKLNDTPIKHGYPGFNGMVGGIQPFLLKFEEGTCRYGNGTNTSKFYWLNPDTKKIEFLTNGGTRTGNRSYNGRYFNFGLKDYQDIKTSLFSSNGSIMKLEYSDILRPRLSKIFDGTRMMSSDRRNSILFETLNDTTWMYSYHRGKYYQGTRLLMQFNKNTGNIGIRAIPGYPGPSHDHHGWLEGGCSTYYARNRDEEVFIKGNVWFQKAKGYSCWNEDSNFWNGVRYYPKTKGKGYIQYLKGVDISEGSGLPYLFDYKFYGDSHRPFWNEDLESGPLKMFRFSNNSYNNITNHNKIIDTTIGSESVNNSIDTGSDYLDFNRMISGYSIEYDSSAGNYILKKNGVEIERLDGAKPVEFPNQDKSLILYKENGYELVFTLSFDSVNLKYIMTRIHTSDLDPYTLNRDTSSSLNQSILLVEKATEKNTYLNMPIQDFLNEYKIKDRTDAAAVHGGTLRFFGSSYYGDPVESYIDAGLNARSTNRWYNRTYANWIDNADKGAYVLFDSQGNRRILSIGVARGWLNIYNYRTVIGNWNSYLNTVFYLKLSGRYISDKNLLFNSYSQLRGEDPMYNAADLSTSLHYFTNAYGETRVFVGNTELSKEQIDTITEHSPDVLEYAGNVYMADIDDGFIRAFKRVNKTTATVVQWNTSTNEIQSNNLEEGDYIVLDGLLDKFNFISDGTKQIITKHGDYFVYKDGANTYLTKVSSFIKDKDGNNTNYRRLSDSYLISQYRTIDGRIYDTNNIEQLMTYVPSRNSYYKGKDSTVLFSKSISYTDVDRPDITIFTLTQNNETFAAGGLRGYGTQSGYKPYDIINDKFLDVQYWKFGDLDYTTHFLDKTYIDLHLSSGSPYWSYPTWGMSHVREKTRTYIMGNDVVINGPTVFYKGSTWLRKMYQTQNQDGYYNNISSNQKFKPVYFPTTQEIGFVDGISNNSVVMGNKSYTVTSEAELRDIVLNNARAITDMLENSALALPWEVDEVQNAWIKDIVYSGDERTYKRLKVEDFNWLEHRDSQIWEDVVEQIPVAVTIDYREVFQYENNGTNIIYTDGEDVFVRKGTITKQIPFLTKSFLDANTIELLEGESYKIGNMIVDLKEIDIEKKYDINGFVPKTYKDGGIYKTVLVTGAMDSITGDYGFLIKDGLDFRNAPGSVNMQSVVPGTVYGDSTTVSSPTGAYDAYGLNLLTKEVHKLGTKLFETANFIIFSSGEEVIIFKLSSGEIILRTSELQLSAGFVSSEITTHLGKRIYIKSTSTNKIILIGDDIDPIISNIASGSSLGMDSPTGVLRISNSTYLIMFADRSFIEIVESGSSINITKIRNENQKVPAYNITGDFSNINFWTIMDTTGDPVTKLYGYSKTNGKFVLTDTKIGAVSYVGTVRLIDDEGNSKIVSRFRDEYGTNYTIYQGVKFAILGN